MAKTKLNTIGVLISKALNHAYINHDKFVSIINVLRKYNEMKEEIKNPENAVEYTMQKRWKRILSVARKILQIKILVLEELDKIKACTKLCYL